MNEMRRAIERRLADSGIESARFEAARLLSEFSENPGQLERAVKLRLSGRPLQYILGEWEFYSLPFFVGDGVLIPRQDTETLVDAALSFLKSRPDSRVCDLCAGSGCVAVSIAKNAPAAAVTAVEKSPQAFAYLKKNIERNGVTVKTLLGDIAEPFGEFELITANPPYIPTGVIDTLSEELSYEPRMALDGGSDGLLFYRLIADKWISHLSGKGAVMTEIGFDQARDVSKIFAAAGLAVETLRDLTGNDRVIIGTQRG